MDIEKFEKLRAMEYFTDEMFNRIFAFQQKLHPAWDTTLPFDERIKGLPLHYLVFSNPDRDPKLFSPTVAPYYPLRGEIRTIAYYIRQVAENPVICDLHAGNGFIGSLLAREGFKIIGLRDPQAKPNQIADFYDASCYEMRTMALQEVTFPFDVAFSSWMPSGVNMTPEIIKHEPKLIVYVHTDHVDKSTGAPQTGTPEAFTDLPARYRLIEEWSLVRPEDMFHSIWPDLSPNIEETRHVKIYADEPFHNLKHWTSMEAGQGYDWEGDLEMILLALEAKSELQARGYRM
jgi:hypothetical protein